MSYDCVERIESGYMEEQITGQEKEKAGVGSMRLVLSWKSCAGTVIGIVSRTCVGKTELYNTLHWA